MQERFDSAVLDTIGATAFFNRELESVKARTYDTKFPELSAANGEIFDIDTSAGPGAEVISYKQFTETGIAKIIANYADDLPLVNIAGKEFFQKVKGIGTAYAWTLQEIRAAVMAGRSLADRLARTARRANDTLVNRIAYLGDAESGLYGILSHPNIPRHELEDDGDASGTSFASKVDTPDKILRDLNEMESVIVDTTNGVERPDTLLMPVAQYQLIATTPRADNSDTTILEFFLKAAIGIKKVIPVHELKGAGEGGTDVMVAYKKSPEHITLEIPQPFEQLPVQEDNLSFKVPCHSRCAGLIVHYPLSALIAEGV